MILPPTLQVLLFGYALNSTVSDSELGVLDESHTPESRELVATLSESRSFKLSGAYLSLSKLSAAISKGEVQAGVVIPYDFARDIQRGYTAEVQFLLNAMDANTATIAQAYAEGVFAAYNASLAGSGLHAQFSNIAAPEVDRRGQVRFTACVSIQPRPGQFLVHGYWRFRIAFDSEWVVGLLRRHG